MKKLLTNLFLFASALTLVGCNMSNDSSIPSLAPGESEGENDFQPIAPSTKPSNTPSEKPSANEDAVKPTPTEENNKPKPKPSTIKLNRSYEVTSSNRRPEIINAYTDGVYSYFMLNLGTISNIPLEDNIAEEFNGTNYELTLTTFESSIEIIEQKVENITKSSETWMHDFKADASVEYKNLAAGLKANLNVAYNMNYNKTLEQLYKENFSRAITNSKSRERSIKIKLDDSFKHGFYRNILVDDADIIANVIKSNDNPNDCYVTTLPVFRGTLAYIWEYSETKQFKVNLDNVFNLTNEYVQGLSMPTNALIPNDLGYKKGFYCGDGTENNPFIIKERPAVKGVINKTPEEQFLMIKDNPDANYRLATDLDFSMYSPINGGHLTSLIDTNFTGKFDGNNHKIKNLDFFATPSNISSKPENSFDLYHQIALFKRVDGEIKNFSIENFNIKFPSYHDYKDQMYGFAFVAGCGNGKIINVNVNSGKIEVERYSSIVGTIASVFSGEIINCNTRIVQILGNGDIGGLVGYLTGNGKIENSSFTHSTIKYIASQGQRSVGGIASNILDKSTIFNCTSKNNTYDITSDGNRLLDPRVGCIVGDAKSGLIQGCDFDEVGRQISKIWVTTYIFAQHNGLCGRIDKANIKR